MSTDVQGTKVARNIAENLNRLSRAHERYRRQTDGRATANRESSRDIFFGWLIIAKNTITSTQPTFLSWRFGLYQRPSSEEVCSIPVPVLATIVMRRGKKSVVRVAQCVAPLVPVQWLLSFFPNMYCVYDPSRTFVGFSVQNSGGRPIDHVVIMRCMVSQCWFVLLRQTWCTLVSGERFC